MIVMRRGKSRRRGQGLTEYIIVAALIAVAAIGVISLFGNNIRGLFAATDNALAGNENTEAVTNEASVKFAAHKSLQTFGSKNTPPTK